MTRARGRTHLLAASVSSSSHSRQSCSLRGKRAAMACRASCSRPRRAQRRRVATSYVWEGVGERQACAAVTAHARLSGPHSRRAGPPPPAGGRQRGRGQRRRWLLPRPRCCCRRCRRPTCSSGRERAREVVATGSATGGGVDGADTSPKLLAPATARAWREAPPRMPNMAVTRVQATGAGFCDRAIARRCAVRHYQGQDVNDVAAKPLGLWARPF